MTHINAFGMGVENVQANAGNAGRGGGTCLAGPNYQAGADGDREKVISFHIIGFICSAHHEQDGHRAQLMPTLLNVVVIETNIHT